MRPHPDKSSSVLVVDDQKEVYELLKVVLSLEGMEAEYASNAADAREAVSLATPDLIVLDLGLPDCDGVELCTELRRRFRGPILILSGRETEESVAYALDAGADEYVAKPFRVREFRARVRALRRRTEASTFDSLEVGPFRLDLAKHRFEVRGEVVPLTKIEFQIMELLMSNRNRVVTADRVLRDIWGGNRGYAQTLRVHIGHIRSKIEEDRSDPQYLLTEPGVGFRFEVPTDALAAAGGAAPEPRLESALNERSARSRR